MFVPSKYQKSVFDFIKNGKGNAVISAVAGSGKTSTIVEALKIIPANKHKLFLAFNKAIVDELKERTNTIPNVLVRTLHSAGFSSMINTYKSRLDNYKYRRFLNESLYLLSKEVTVDTDDEDQKQFKSRVIKLLDLSRASLANDNKSIENIAAQHDIELLYDEIDVVKKLMQWGIDNPRIIDYCDMIWITVKKNLRVIQYDWVLIDECQDLSPMQNKLFQMMIKPVTGRFIAVGDRKQSIQFFAGAGNDSFDNIAALPNTKEFPLSICYRCDKKIVENAKTLVSQIECRENAQEGIVEEIDTLDSLKEGDMILSRTNAPLTSLIMKLISNNIPSYIKGKDIGRNLINLVKRTKKLDIESMFNILYNELYKIQIKVSKRNKISLEEAKDDYQYINMEDKINCLNNLSFGCLNTLELINKIDNLFKDYSKGICLSSIHKSKGLESDRVFIIDLDKLPLKKAMKNPIQAQQEKNLMYVAYTRPKHELYLVNVPVKDIRISNNE